MSCCCQNPLQKIYISTISNVRMMWLWYGKKLLLSEPGVPPTRFIVSGALQQSNKSRWGRSVELRWSPLTSSPYHQCEWVLWSTTFILFYTLFDYYLLGNVRMPGAFKLQMCAFWYWRTWCCPMWQCTDMLYNTMPLPYVFHVFMILLSLLIVFFFLYFLLTCFTSHLILYEYSVGLQC